MKNILSLSLIALAIGLGIFVIKPAYANIQTLQTQKSSYDDALASAKQLQTVRDSLTQSYNGISDTDKAKLALVLPSAFDPVKLTSDLSTAAASQGLTVNHVQVADNSDSDNSRTDVAATTTSDSYKTYSLSLSITGQYPAFVQFLKIAESDAELLDLRQVSIQSGSLAGELNFNASFDTYSQ